MTKDGKKVVDAFIFYNELDLLDARLHEHDSFVDYFILAESGVAFNGQPKQMFFKENKFRYSDFNGKIRGIEYDHFQGGDSWNREWGLRNSVKEGVKELFIDGVIKDDDWVIISDLDEIIRSSKFNYIDFDNDKRYKFDLSFRYYKFNCREINDGWAGPIMVPVSVFLEHKPQDIRHHGNNVDIPNESIVYVKNAGWHFSYMGGIDKIISKINTGGHQELNTDYYKEKARLEMKVKYGEDLFDREGHEWEFINDEDYPKYILDHPEIYQDYFQPMKRYKFQLVIPFSGDYDKLNWAMESGFKEVYKYSIYAIKIVVVNNSGINIDLSKITLGKMDYIVENLIEPMLISQTLNWAIKRAKLLGHDFMCWCHDDCAIKANGLKLMIDKYEEVKYNKWGTIFLAKDGDVFSFYNINFNFEENVWYEPMMFPVYMMDSHYFRVMRLRGWTMEYANWEHEKDFIIHSGSSTLKRDMIFKRKNDLMQKSLRTLYFDIWNCQPEDGIIMGSQDPHANGTC